ncbi:hypothetical protein TY91_15910 [Secundilactobacillus collinoides]|uniref:Uncharacterized protein n=1 Tax=Secundilactobacillus collinoides TaxID=33960 RepID=A0A166FQL5_SECCO|nr:hypothetical protein TY91_15910 [Secundilactobacillus collinoides]
MVSEWQHSDQFLYLKNIHLLMKFVNRSNIMASIAQILANQFIMVGKTGLSEEEKTRRKPKGK